MSKKTASKSVARKTATSTQAAVAEPPKPTGPRSFQKAVDVPDPTPEQEKARAAAVVVGDRQRRTAIELRRAGNEVTFIPLTDGPFEVRRLSVLAFDATYKPLVDYPVGRAAKLYVGFMSDLGGSSDVINELAKLITITPEERDMAEKRGTNNRTTTKTTKTAAPKTSAKPAVKVTTVAKAVKPEPQAKPAAAVVKPAAPVKAPAAKPAKEGGGRAATAASTIRDLIMEHKLTNEEIVAAVRKAFPDSRIDVGDVGWHRCNMKRKGLDVPAAVVKAA